MLTLSPFKLNGAMASRTPSPNVNFQGHKDRNNSLMQPDAARMGIQLKDKLVKSPKTQPRFGAGNENYTNQQEEQIRRVMAELKVVPHTTQKASEKLVAVSKSVGMHAFVHWVGDHISWIVEKLSNFAETIKDFIKDKWEDAIDWLFN
jgi:hypothetical protein